MPKRISFVLPVFEPNLVTLEKCVKSIAGQGFKDWESIWVLDGPCPEAEDMIKKYITDAKVVTIEHSGAPAARNEGFKHATGDIVCFFDSDSAIEREASRAWVDIFDAKPDIGFIYAGYKWFDENQRPYDSEDFDPWLLRVNNYISSCFPVRREFVPTWNESLKSLQDWDFWLSVVEKGGKGHRMQGHAFTTATPTPKSISGQGCTKEAWLDRLEAVKKLHGIAIRETCVSSLSARHEGIRLAKLIDADYRDFPLAMPNRYKTVIQIGFSFQPSVCELHSSVFGVYQKVKNILFWTADDVTEVYNAVGTKALREYSALLNRIATQYVEDIESKRIMGECGFLTEVMPLPLVNEQGIEPMPEKPRFLLDVEDNWSHIFNAIEKSIPEAEFDKGVGAKEIKDYTGLIHFRAEPITDAAMKRMMIAGRYIVSNVQVPFAGFIDEKQAADTFIPEFVNKVRGIIGKPINDDARKYYDNALSASNLLGVLTK